MMSADRRSGLGRSSGRRSKFSGDDRGELEAIEMVVAVKGSNDEC